jgi:S-adenosylmethionine synthetase
MGVTVTALPPAPAGTAVEIVERKGIGHPDTICDSVAEAASRALARFYHGRFGQILHHNVDKALLVGGTARPHFGGGEIVTPIEIILAGRATREVRGVPVAVDEIATKAARDWLRTHLRSLDAEHQVRIRCMIRPSSRALVELFERQRSGGAVLANDTSCGVGYAPLSALERTVLAVEGALQEARIDFRAIGEDLKVMGVAQGGGTHLTIACAIVAAHVSGMGAYRAAKARIAEIAGVVAPGAQIAVNTADGDTEDSVYLTVTGTSAEAGDDGEVGRGNRANGLITPCRPMSLEAVAGKNPVSHVGKLYNLAAQKIAAAAAELPEIAEAQCFLVSDIGQPITEPRVAELRARLYPGVELPAVAPRLEALVREGLARLPELWREVLAGTLAVC